METVKTIQEWQKLFSTAINEKFGPCDAIKRAQYIQQEAEDIKVALMVEGGQLKEGENHQYRDADERIAGLLANVFELMERRETQIEKELTKALRWFQDPDTNTASGSIR